MIIEWFKSTIENIKERISNPFTVRNQTPFAGAFVISFVLYNWKLIFSLFTFDFSESRVSKIDIISKFLLEEPWLCRIWYSILFAFCSIITFYILNNISLGITTIFNRWFRGFILSVTDKSKIIPRSELEDKERKMTTLRTKHEDLKIKFQESSSEIEEYKNQIKSKDENFVGLVLKRDELQKELDDLKRKTNANLSEISRLNTEMNSLNVEFDNRQSKLNDIESQKNKFRIISGEYGNEVQTIEVTKVVSDLFSRQGKLIVSNNQLGFDPIRFSIKYLKIIYEFKQIVNEIKAIEGEEIHFAENKLIVTPTNESRKNRNWLDNIVNFSKLFNGEWILKYSKDGKDAFENVIIDADGRYYIDKKYAYNLLIPELTNDKIRVMKIKRDNEKHSDEILKLVNPKLITGTDNLGYELIYTKK